MAKKTINQALKDLFLGLGGDASALADNTSVSDYIADLESAIKTAAAAELPTPEAEDIGKTVSVVSDGESGAEYDLTTLASGGVKYIDVSISQDSETEEYEVLFPSGVTIDTILADINNGIDIKLRDPRSVNAQKIFTINAIGTLDTQNNKEVHFINVKYYSSKIVCYEIAYVGRTDTLSYSEKTYTIQAT